jgi:hypothetical protein
MNHLVAIALLCLDLSAAAAAQHSSARVAVGSGTFVKPSDAAEALVTSSPRASGPGETTPAPAQANASSPHASTSKEFDLLSASVPIGVATLGLIGVFVQSWFVTRYNRRAKRIDIATHCNERYDRMQAVKLEMGAFGDSRVINLTTGLQTPLTSRLSRTGAS